MLLEHEITLPAVELDYRPETGTAYHEAIEIEWRDLNESIYIASGQAARDALPSNYYVLDKASIEADGMPTISESCGFETGVSSISSGTVKILDRDQQFSDIAAIKYMNSRAIMNSICRIYIWPTDVTFNADRHLHGTYQLGNSSYQHGVLSLPISDVKRKLDTEIFTEKTWRLNSTLLRSETATIPTTLDPLDYDVPADNEFLFMHTQAYSIQPSMNVGYVVLEDGDKKEIIAHSGLRLSGGVYSFEIIKRGALNTGVYEWEVDGSTEDSSKPELKEYIYIEETKANQIMIAATGTTIDGRVAPAHWGAKLSASDLDLSALYQSNTLERHTVANPKATTAKTHIEKQFLTFGPAVFTLNRHGQLRYTPEITNGEVGPNIQVFSDDNVDLSRVSNYEQVTRNVYAVAGLKWGRNPVSEKYLSPVYVSDLEAVERNRSEKTKTYTSDTMTSGTHTEGQVRMLTGIIYDRHINPTHKISFPVNYNHRWIECGTRHRVKFSTVTTHVNGTSTSQPLDRMMTLIAKTVDMNKRTVSLTFQGYAERPDALKNSPEPTLPQSEFERDGISITDVAGVNISGGVLSGTPTLSLKQKYYYIGNLTLGANFRPTWAEAYGAKFCLWVMGQLYIDCVLDLSGRSMAAPGIGAAGASSATPGQAGYAFTTESGGSIHVYDTGTLYGSSIYKYRQKVQSNPVSYSQPRAQVESHRLALDTSDGRLKGFPPDTGGSSGGGSDRDSYTYPAGTIRLDTDDYALSGHNTEWFDGLDGIRGGLGFEFVSYPGSNIRGAGQLITSAAEGNTVSAYVSGGGSLAVQPNIWVRSANSGPGMPGVLSWGIDGFGTKPSITAANFIANSSYIGTGSEAYNAPIWTGAIKYADIDDGPVRHSYYAPPPTTNYWQAAHDVVYIPPVQSTQGVVNDIDLAFQNQRDNLIQLIIADGVPTNGNPGDLAVSQAMLDDTANLAPTALIMNNQREWVSMDWANAYQTYHTLLFINREYGGTQTFYQETRPTNYNDGDAWKDKTTGLTWILHVPPERDELLYDIDPLIGGELIRDPNFVLTAEGQQVYTFTDNLELEPLNVFQQIIASIELAFITVGSITGDFKLKDTDTDDPVSDEVLYPPTGLTLTAVDSNNITARWTLPDDLTGIDGYQITLNGIVINGTDVTLTSLTFRGMSADTDYTVTIRSVNDEGAQSAATSATVRTPVDGPGHTLTIYTTGRLVSGTTTGFDTGRQVSLRLDDNSYHYDNIDESGDFSITVSSGYDDNAGKQASLYINNIDDSIFLNPHFTYTIN